MENMTKALEIAASVLIGVLILSLLVFGYNQIREQKNKPGVPCKAIDFAKHAWLYFIKSLSGPT